MLRENQFIRKYVEGKKPLSSFGGYGGVEYPKTAKRGQSLLVGEAAGFQDVARGFGMTYALRSGQLAARSILENLDYDTLWKKDFGKDLRLDFSVRFLMSVLGDRLIEMYFRDVKDGELIDLDDYMPHGAITDAALGAAFQAEMLKKKMFGHW
jgi:flavin-dependent dehydrogenase